MDSACDMHQYAVLGQKCVQGYCGAVAVARVIDVDNSTVMALQHRGHQGGGAAQAAYGDAFAEIGQGGQIVGKSVVGHDSDGGADIGHTAAEGIGGSGAEGQTRNIDAQVGLKHPAQRGVQIRPTAVTRQLHGGAHLGGAVAQGIHRRR